MRMADTDRINGWQRVHTLLTETTFEGDREVPLIRVYVGHEGEGLGCPQLARTIPMLQCDPKNPGDILEVDDHWADTLRWFAMSRPGVSKVKPEKSSMKRFAPEVQKALRRGTKRKVLGAAAR